MTTDNKALADRLTSMASCITPGGLNDAEIALMREAAAALSTQADKARVPDGLIDALRCQRQVDEEGIECGVSRQAVGEAIEILESLTTPQSQVDEGRGEVATVIATELAKLDGYDPTDPHGGLYDLRWSGGTEPEPQGDAWSMDYLPKAEKIAAALTPQPQGDSSPNADRMAIRMLVAAGFVTEAKANEALNIAHGFDKGPLTPQARPDGGEVFAWFREQPREWDILKEGDLSKPAAPDKMAPIR